MMHTAKRIVCLSILSLFTACGPSVTELENAENELIRKATIDIPCLKGYRAMFPTPPILMHSDWYKTGNAIMQAQGVFHDRYLLMLQIRVRVDPKKRMITGFDAPSITLDEVESVSGSAEGPLKIDHGDSRTISSEQWNKIVASGGLVSAAGIPAKTNEPVAGISKLKVYLRQSPKE